MKRIAIVAIAAALFASTAAIAFADDTDEEAESESVVTQELNDKQMMKARLLADYMIGDVVVDEEDEAAVAAAAAAADAATEEIVALRTGDPAVGWGALFKLTQLAKAYGVDLEVFLADYGEGDEWGFGELFKNLDDDQKALLDGDAKNFGQLKKQAKEPKTNNGKKP